MTEDHEAGASTDTLPSPEDEVALARRLARALSESSPEDEVSSEQRATALGGCDALPEITSSTRSTCLTEDEILQYREGAASPAQLTRIDEHMDKCSDCRELVALLIPKELENAGTSEVTSFQPGFLVAGRYEIERFIGKGGMGEVYSAIDQLTNTRVAMKTVVCTAADDPRAARKLLDEVRHAQRVAHVNVCRIYDLHEHEDTLRGRVPFFTMEYIDGETLGARLRRGALPLPTIRTLARQLLAGLSAAHARGVLHLDFKSDNVMLRRDGNGVEAVIMDFGLSRAPDMEARLRTSERLLGAGTLPYMSLEQLECRAELGPAADVYSFGVVLHEMLTGELPFRGQSLGAMLLRQLRERPPAPSAIVPALSTAVDDFVRKCLSRAPESRPKDAETALALLDSIAEWERAKLRRPRPLYLVMGGALVGLGLFGVWRARPDPRGLASQKTGATEDVSVVSRRLEAELPPRARLDEPPREGEDEPTEPPREPPPRETRPAESDGAPSSSKLERPPQRREPSRSTAHSVDSRPNTAQQSALTDAGAKKPTHRRWQGSAPQHVPKPRPL